MRVSFSSLFVLATAALGLAQPSARKISLNPPLSSLNPDFEAELGIPNPEPQSNAKRFAQGLPPLTPKALARHRHRHANRQAPHHGSPVDAARRSAPSSGPSVSVSCNVLVRRQDGTDVGYVTKTWNKYGEYGATQDGPDDALEVQFSYDPNDPGSLSSLDLLATNGPSGSYPYFGLTTGYEADDDNIGPGSYNYGYVVGTAQAPRGPPSSTTPNSFSSATNFEESTESAVWSYDPTSRSLTPQWTNTDGSAPATYLMLGTDANGYPVLTMTGDPQALNGALEANFPIVNFICV